jgi:hypothetical protein
LGDQAKATDNARDCRLVTLAGILPDADGIGLLADGLNQALGRQPTFYYQHYHHYLLHGAFGAVLVSGFLALFARNKWRVALLCLAVFHLHLLCDFIGSRGPRPEDLWPIYYFGPFRQDPTWVWKGQLPLDAWPNRLLAVCLLAAALWMPVRLGYSVAGVFSARLDRAVVAALRKWHASLLACVRTPPPVA